MTKKTKNIEPNLGPLSQEAIDTLCELVRAPTNEDVKSIVFEALKTNTEPNYELLDRDMKKYVRASFEAFQLKIKNLNRLKLMLPVVDRDEDYIMLITSLYQRALSAKSVEILQAALCKKQNQLTLSRTYNIPQSNISRLLSKFEKVETNAKQAIISFLL